MELRRNRRYWCRHAADTTRIEVFVLAYRSLTGCERNARKRARQTKPSAPPVQARDLSWWRRRFRLRIAILSQLLRMRKIAAAHYSLTGWPIALSCIVPKKKSKIARFQQSHGVLIMYYVEA